MRTIRISVFVGGLIAMALALGFVFRVPLAISIWPWEDGRYSYLFVGSILAAASAAALWIGWTGQLGAIPAGSLNIFVIGLTTSIYFFILASQGRTRMFSFAILSTLTALVTGIAFLWSRRLPLEDLRPTPRPVLVSFLMFIIALILSGTALLLRKPIFPWDLNPDSSVIFGCIFLGDAFYFLYGLFRPHLGNGLGQLLSFLVYDLVLIVPFVLLFDTVGPNHMINLIAYIFMLLYSGILAVYYLFISPQTRFGTQA